jgi:hypothetical protein
VKITAKARCNLRESVDAEQDRVAFNADYMDEEGREINAEWARYTPALSISMSVRKDVRFKPGQSYTLTFDDGE